MQLIYYFPLFLTICFGKPIKKLAEVNRLSLLPASAGFLLGLHIDPKEGVICFSEMLGYLQTTKC
jgi:hypothetical protein